MKKVIRKDPTFTSFLHVLNRIEGASTAARANAAEALTQQQRPQGAGGGRLLPVQSVPAKSSPST